jgi:FtsZ-binding cell division protein ZapB
MSQDKQKLLEIRKNQLASLGEMVKSLKEETDKLKKDNEQLSHERTRLQNEEETLDVRLKSILREKEFLFARLMDVERTIEELQ